MSTGFNNFNSGYKIGTNKSNNFGEQNPIYNNPFHINLLQNIQQDAGKFKYNDTTFRAQWDTIGSIYNTLSDACNDSKTLSKDMKSTVGFEGQSRNELLAFSDLLNQYNGSFSGQTSGINPTLKYNNAVSACIYKVEKFQYSKNLIWIE